MKKLPLIFFSFLFLLFPSGAEAATFSVVNPVGGSCFSPGQLVNIAWGASTAPAVDHYSVTYTTNGSVPPTYTNNSSAWKIGHAWGGVSQTSIGWSVPIFSSTTVKIWVESEKKNDSQLELVSSGFFNVKTTCKVSPPPSPSPSPKPSPSSNPTSQAQPSPNPIFTETQASSSSASQNQRISLGSTKPQAKSPTQIASSKNFFWLYAILFLVALGGSLFLIKEYGFLWRFLKPAKKQPVDPMIQIKGPAPVKPTNFTVEEIEKLREQEETLKPGETDLKSS